MSDGSPSLYCGVEVMESVLYGVEVDVESVDEDVVGDELDDVASGAGAGVLATPVTGSLGAPLPKSVTYPASNLRELPAQHVVSKIAIIPHRIWCAHCPLITRLAFARVRARRPVPGTLSRRRSALASG